jgi:hypothetical protein
VFSVRVLVTLSEPKINNVDVVLGAFGAPNQKVVGLDVAVNDSFLVNLLNALDLFKSVRFQNNLPSGVRCGRPS